jgi:hypothetical protein
MLWQQVSGAVHDNERQNSLGQLLSYTGISIYFGAKTMANESLAFRLSGAYGGTSTPETFCSNSSPWKVIVVMQIDDLENQNKENSVQLMGP